MIALVMGRAYECKNCKHMDYWHVKDSGECTHQWHGQCPCPGYEQGEEI